MSVETANIPLVSIVCTTYNHQNYIKDALDGFLIQQIDFPIEIIVHDDASTDDTALILKEYENKYPHLFCNIYQQENQYSKGIDIWGNLFRNYCRGQYIAICEGDDYWTEPLKLQEQVQWLEGHKEYSSAVHNAWIIYQDGSKVRFNDKKVPNVLLFTDVLNSWLIPTASILFRKELFLNLRESPFKFYSSDYVLGLFLANSGLIHYNKEVMSVYRKQSSPNSLSVKLNDRYAYILEQQNLMLTYFNAMTDFKYIRYIDKKIKCNKNEIDFLKLKNNNLLLPFFKMPFFTLKRLINKVK